MTGNNWFRKMGIIIPLLFLYSNLAEARSLQRSQTTILQRIPSYSLTILSPNSSSNVQGSIQVKGTAAGFKNVEVFSSNRTLLSRSTPDGSGNFTASVDTTKLSNGSQTLTVDAWDAAAGQPYTHTAEKKISLIVQNGTAPTPAPSPTPAPAPLPAGLYTLSILSPASGATVNGSLQIKGTGPGFLNVEIFGASGALLARVTPDSAGNFTASVDTTKLANGSQNLKIDAWDSPAGTMANQFAEKMLSVNVQNALSTPAPSPTPVPAPVPAPSPSPSVSGQIVDYYGDSTVWGYKSGVGTQVAKPAPTAFGEQLPGVTVRNEGVSGTTACQLLNGQDGVHPDWDTQMSRSNATIVIINHAINDEWKYDMNTYKSCMSSLAQKAKAHGKKVIFETPNPTRDAGPEALGSMADAMKAVASQYQAPVIDQYTYLMNYLNGASPYTICPDGLHPTEQVYIMKGQYAAQVFKSLFGSSSTPAPAPSPAPSYSLSISSPSSGQTVSGSIQIKGSGPGFLNVEVYSADGVRLAQVTPSSSGSFSASVDTTKLYNGSQSLTIYGWDSPAGQAFNHSGQTKLDVTVQNASNPAPPPSNTGAGPAGQDANAWSLVFSDEFDSGFNSGKWNDHVWYESSNPTKNYSVENGSLLIWPQRDASGNFFNRTIDTDGKFETTYGYFEVEAKLPVGRGTWPAFWLYAHPGNDRPEIDVMEAYSGGGPNSGWSDANLHPTNFGMTLHKANGDYSYHEVPYAHTSAEFIGAVDLSANFHKYAVKWEPSGITFYFDGKQIGSKYNDSAGYYNRPMYLLLDLWFGSASGTPDGSTPTGKGNAYIVNYIRAWKAK